jgi:hypothetical protein
LILVSYEASSLTGCASPSFPAFASFSFLPICRYSNLIDDDLHLRLQTLTQCVELYCQRVYEKAIHQLIIDRSINFQRLPVIANLIQLLQCWRRNCSRCVFIFFSVLTAERK